MIYNEWEGPAHYLGPLTRYLRSPGKNPDGSRKPPPAPGTPGRARFLGGRGFSVPIGTSDDDWQFARRMMKANASQVLDGATKPLKKPVLHVAMSWDRGQTPSDADMMDAAARMAGKIQMGGDQYQYVVVRHLEKDHDHAHVVLIRRNTHTGAAAPSYQRRMRGWNFAVEHDRKMRDEHGIPIPPALQWREDRAQAALRGDHAEQRRLLFKEGVSPLDGRRTVNNAVVRTTAINQAAAYAGKFAEEQTAYREAWARSNNLIKLKVTPDSPVMAFTTARIHRSESRIIGLAKHIREHHGVEIDDQAIDDVAREMGLSAEQKTELIHATRNNGLSMTTGHAGSGKSYSDIAWRKVMERSGFKVRGTSTSNNVVQQKQKDGFNAATLWQVNQQAAVYERALRRHEAVLRAGKTPKRPAPLPPWTKHTAWSIDEGSQINDDDLERFLRNVKRYGGKVKITMDDQQNTAVERCGTLSYLESKIGSAKLTENWRNPAEAETWKRMRSGKKEDWTKVADDLERLNSLKWDPSKDTSIDHFVRDYMDDVRRDPHAPRQGVAIRRIETAALNAKIQEAMKAEGLLGPGFKLTTAHGEQTFHVGDRIRLTESARDPTLKRKGATNGAYGKIDSLTQHDDGSHDVVFSPERKPNEQPRKLTLKVGDGEHDMRGLRLGYVDTSWGVQGISTGRTFAMHDPMNSRFSSYVSWSRHGEEGGLSIYNSTSDTENKSQFADQGRNGKQKLSAHHYYLDDDERARLKAMPYDRPEPLTYPNRRPAPQPPPPVPPQQPPPPPPPRQAPAINPLSDIHAGSLSPAPAPDPSLGRSRGPRL